jgi:Zn-dependent protease
VIHELAHAVTALWLGDTTAKDEGRITLNPLKHLDPIGTLLIVLVGFGWARPVPVMSNRLRFGKIGLALTALAGPLANFILGFVLVFIIMLFFLDSYVGTYLLQAAFLTVFLGVFNLLPIPPFDGSKIIAPLLPNKIYEPFVSGGGASMVIILIILVTRAHVRFIVPVVEFILWNIMWATGAQLLF